MSKWMGHWALPNARSRPHRPFVPLFHQQEGARIGRGEDPGAIVHALCLIFVYGKLAEKP